MYSKDGQVIDRREMLRVKLRSLVAEARIIKRQEARVRRGELREELSLHRRTVVRRAARETGLALGFIKGREYREMEPTTHLPPDWVSVDKMLKKYGPSGISVERFKPAA